MNGRGRRATIALATLGGMLVAAGGCGDRGQPPPSTDVVAVVGGELFTFGEFEDYLQQQLGEPGRGLASDVLSRMFDRFLDEQLLARLALDRGVAPKSATRRTAIDRLLAAAAAAEAGGGEPDEAEIEAYYSGHHDEFARPERVRLRQILVGDRATADRALGELRAGADFAEVSRRLAGGGEEASIGDQGVLARDELPPAFAEIIFGLAPGEISDVIAADYGFHLFQVVERLPAETLPLAAAREEIRDRLRQQAADRRLSALAAEARNRYDVEVFERNLPFNYQGKYSAETH
jgi:peptidyl-prolyl cis-trans isomerase C